MFCCKALETASKGNGNAVRLKIFTLKVITAYSEMDSGNQANGSLWIKVGLIFFSLQWQSFGRHAKEYGSWPIQRPSCFHCWEKKGLWNIYWAR